jgi:amino acid adenylation domain-containing protein
VPFEHLVQSLKQPRDDSRSPIYQAMFSFQDVRQRVLSWGDLQHEHLPLFQRGAADDIGLWFIEQEQNLLGGLTYNTDIFSAETAARFREHYETLLASALGAPNQAVCQLALLPTRERALLRRWNATASAIADTDMHGLFEAQCDRAPDRIALRDAGRKSTYAELEARANRIAHLLRSHGVGRGSLVGIALDRDADMVASVLGALKTGAGYVPLDPDFPKNRLDYMVDDAGLMALVTRSRHVGRFDLRGKPVLELDRLSAQLDALPITRIGRDGEAANGDSIAYVIYTSGSTGQPKGVEIPHRAVVNFLASMIERPGLRADDRLLAVTTLSFDIAVLELFGPLSVGAEVVLARHEQAIDGEALVALLDQHDINVMQATPATWRMLLRTGWTGRKGFRALCGGEALAPDLAMQLQDGCSEVWNLYGPTETTVWSTCWKVDPAEQGISIGTPIANTTVWILDEQRRLCPIGVPGELWIGGSGVALGYRHRPEWSAERFIEDPFADEPGARLYCSGDRGRWRSDGLLEHLGRLDFQVKLRGFRIELGEIELAARRDAAVTDCVAIVYDFSEQDRRLVLYVASAEADDTLLPRVRELLAAQLPPYMQPQHLVRLASLPHTPNGKVDRKALPAPLQPQASQSENAMGSLLADPRQRYLGRLWCELIGIADVLPRDNFFDVGGHSLLAVELVARVRRETGTRLNLLDIATGTLASLALELSEPETAEMPHGKPASIGARLRNLLRLR